MTRAGTGGWSAARALYGLAVSVAAPLSLPLLAIHPRLRGGLAQRLGFNLPRTSSTSPPIWFHGASAGDMLALRPLARAAAALELPVVQSAWTRSGAQMALHGAPGPVVMAPLDHPLAVARTLGRLRPAALVLECLELWPELVLQCAGRGIPVAVVNGRLSRRSARAYRRWAGLFRPCFGALSLVSALSPEDAARFEEAGVDPRVLRVGRSSKYAALLAPRPAADAPIPLPLLVLGSVHAGEEPLLLPLVAGLLLQIPGLQVVWAPRYPHRAPGVVRALRARQVPARTWSGDEGRDALAPGEVAVLDTMGLLRGWYGRARAAFVGGTLVPHGGHNLLEPAAAGVPLVSGPHLEHVAAEAEALQRSGSARVADDTETLQRQLACWLVEEEPWRRASRGACVVAAEFVRGGRRTTDAVMERVVELARHGGDR